MPDPTRRTVSASQVAGLWNKGRMTRWLIYQWVKGVDIDPADDNRLSWGRRLEPLTREAAADHLRLEVHPNALGYVILDDPRLGCTVDAVTVCPSRGRGVVELKCCFDWPQWRDAWHQGEAPPEEVELQLQAQMMVTGAAWGVIAVWFSAEVYYFERRPEPKLQEAITTEVNAFWREVEEGREPDAFGTERELAVLRQIYQAPPAPKLVQVGEAMQAEMASHWASTAQSLICRKSADRTRALILAEAARQEADMLTGGGWLAKISKTSNGAIRLSVLPPLDTTHGK